MKKCFLKHICIIIALLFVVSSFPSCSVLTRQKKYSKSYFEYFDTVSTLTVYADSKKDFERYEAEFEKLIGEYHKLLDIYNEYEGINNLFTVNNNAGLTEIKVDPRLFEAISFGVEMHGLTNGYTNIAMGSVLSIWHDTRERANGGEAVTLPSNEEINKAMLHCDIAKLNLNNEASSVYIEDAEMSLDLGAVAKGFVTEKAVALLEELGCESFLINLGGNTAGIGIKPDGNAWSAMVENPFDDGKKGYDDIISLDGKSLVTSGSYQRYFTLGGKNYSHIISVENGKPADLFASVSILAPASISGSADALSTALFCMSYEDGLALISSIDGVEALWIYSDGEIRLSEGFGG